ncbi:hypothetical protein BDR03DRAFT_40414 [Suillus americanus]|nr:hypothetical protein BDR03DRAFT_40414 [Suillus americanus]
MSRRLATNYMGQIIGFFPFISPVLLHLFALVMCYIPPYSVLLQPYSPVAMHAPDVLDNNLSFYHVAGHCQMSNHIGQNVAGRGSVKVLYKDIGNDASSAQKRE